MERIGSYSVEEYMRLTESFHGYTSPGVLMGGIMVDLAGSFMPEGILFDAICETPSCLPDAIQLLTPCTVGNGWLKIINFGRYALTLYEKHGGEGTRVFLDAARLEPWPELRGWFLKHRSKAEQDEKRLLAEIVEAGRSVYGVQAVRVAPRYLGKKSKGAIGICGVCGEAYPRQDGDVCRACQGENPYVFMQRRALPPTEAMPSGAEPPSSIEGYEAKSG